MLKCHQCKHERDEVHFRPMMSCCVFCEVEVAYKAVDVLEHFINNNPPVGEPMRQLCSCCKTLNFWVNLHERGGKKYCGGCLEGLKHASEVEPKDLPAIADLFLDLFGGEETIN